MAKTTADGAAPRTPKQNPVLDGDAAPLAASPADPPQAKAVTAAHARARKAVESATTAKAAAKAAAAKPKAAPKSGRRTGESAYEASARARREAGRGPQGPDLRADLREFVAARPQGWGHHDWLWFIDHLRERGHDTSDPDGIGLALERERLAATLEQVQGMGPRRVTTLVERYDTLYSMQGADVDELARLPGMNRPLAEKVRQALA